ncbi:hypothetical protein Tco_0400256 [Tanacetum coccineum]
MQILDAAIPLPGLPVITVFPLVARYGQNILVPADEEKAKVIAFDEINKSPKENKRRLTAQIWATKGFLDKAKGNLLGMEIVTDRGSRTLKVSQSGYMQEILNNYRMDNGKSVSVPLGAHFKTSLMYWMVSVTRPDIAYDVSIGTADVGLVYGRDQGKHLDVVSVFPGCSDYG